MTSVAALRLPLTLLATAWLVACSTPPTGVAEVLDRPAERQLISGLRLYDDAQYPEAETALREALRLQLASPRDRASAHKTLAFIFCTSQREAECEAAFRAARAADPQFQLGKSEAGHPLWGPVYQRSLR
jgi:Tfp pilus assembly protein PilF